MDSVIFLILFLWVSATGVNFLPAVVTGAIVYTSGIIIADTIVKLSVHNVNF